MKKLLAMALVAGLISIGCAPGTTKTTIKSPTGMSTSERTSGHDTNRENMPVTKTTEKTKGDHSTKTTEKGDK